MYIYITYNNFIFTNSIKNNFICTNFIYNNYVMNK